MPKEREKIELRPVDEEDEKVHRFVRLHADAVEEVVEVQPVRVGRAYSHGGMAGGEQLERIKTRSNEPDIGSLIERGDVSHENQWEPGPVESWKLPWGWAALLGCLFAGGIIWSLVAVNRSNENLERIVDESDKLIENTLQEEEDAERMIAGIEKALRGFFNSGSVEGMLGFVRQPQRVATLMEKHYAETPYTPTRMERVVGMSPLTIGNHASFWVASCHLEDGDVVQVLVEADKSKVAKVDWETYVTYQPMPWDEFARSRPGGFTGDFRVHAEQDNYYTHEFSDSGTYVSFRLTALKGEESLTGYAPRGGDVERELSRVIEDNGGRASSVILRLHLPKDMRSNRGVIVERLVCPRWVYLDNPENGDP